MSGNSILLDTNIILYILSGNKGVARQIQGNEIYISFVTELELLGYKSIGDSEQETIKQFLSECTIIDINASIKANTIAIKQKLSVKLPDAIIAGTAQFLNMTLATADKNLSRVKDLDVLLLEP